MRMLQKEILRKTGRDIFPIANKEGGNHSALDSVQSHVDLLSGDTYLCQQDVLPGYLSPYSTPVPDH